MAIAASAKQARKRLPSSEAVIRKVPTSFMFNLWKLIVIITNGCWALPFRKANKEAWQTGVEELASKIFDIRKECFRKVSSTFKRV
jgi:hypothetical protein